MDHASTFVDSQGSSLCSRRPRSRKSGRINAVYSQGVRSGCNRHASWVMVTQQWGLYYSCAASVVEWSCICMRQCVSCVGACSCTSCGSIQLVRLWCVYGCCGCIHVDILNQAASKLRILYCFMLPAHSTGSTVKALVRTVRAASWCSSLDCRAMLSVSGHW
jgi:hypothetical protein